MEFRHQITYDAPASAVFDMLGDPEFRRAAAQAMDVVSADVTCDRTGERLSVRIDQVQRTQGVPGFARKFAGETTRAVQTEEWPSPEGGSITIETPGKPTRVTGRITLSESGGRTTETLEGEVEVTVPLIGGKLAGLAARLIGEGMDKEHAVGVAWLAGGSK